MIKLIVTDIDGTLVPEGTNDINPELFSLIKFLKTKGIRFVVASGRHKSCIDKMFAPVKDDILYITSNGAYTGTTNHQMAVSAFTKNVYQQLFHDFDTQIQKPYYAETIDTAYTICPDSEFIHFMNESYGYDMQHCSSMSDIKDTIIKLALYHPEHISMIDSEWLTKWNKICKSVISGTHWIDFIPQNTNKGSALAKLQQSLGITIQETVAFGDQVNDVEMLKQAYFSFAVDNANPTVKNAARFTCDSCNNNGVIKTLKQLFIEEKEF